MKISRLVIAVTMLLILASGAYGLSATLGNAKMILRPDITSGQVTRIDKTLLLRNVNELPVKVTLSLDEGLMGIVTLPQTEYTLQPDEEVNAPFVISISKEGYYDGRIRVLYSSADPTIKENSVGLASHIIIITSGHTPTNGSNTPATVTPQEQNNSQNTPPAVSQKQNSTSNLAQTSNFGHIAGIVAVVIVVILGGLLSFIILRRVW